MGWNPCNLHTDFDLIFSVGFNLEHVVIRVTCSSFRNEAALSRLLSVATKGEYNRVLPNEQV